MCNEDLLAAWLLTRPRNVQDFAARHPFVPFHPVEIGGVRFYFLGYWEQKGIIVSTLSPFDNYEDAVAHRQHICADHFE